MFTKRRPLRQTVRPIGRWIFRLRSDVARLRTSFDRRYLGCLPDPSFISRGKARWLSVKWLLTGLISRRFAAAGRRKSGAFVTPKRRSVIFLHHCYYNFLYLAKALRQRGWDAVSVSLDSPDDPNRKFTHGEDINLFDPDPQVIRENLATFVAQMPERFGMVHFYGVGRMSFYPNVWDTNQSFDTTPIDFLYFKQRGMKIGCTSSGCLDGISQTRFKAWSGGCCDKCVWQLHPEICSDRRNLAWGAKRDRIIDLFATEGNPALDFQGNARCYREPLTQALDPAVWDPTLEVPAALRLARSKDEVLIYHAVGNMALRSRNGRNVKGSAAVVAAVDRLKAEGKSVRLVTAHDMPNLDVRFIQIQADVVVDQLVYGRYGSTARESLMLGKPTVCRIDEREPAGGRVLASLAESPIVPADEGTIYEVLKDLVAVRERRQEIGARSRAYALKWYGMEACGERFQRVYDGLMEGRTAAEIENEEFATGVLPFPPTEPKRASRTDSGRIPLATEN